MQVRTGRVRAGSRDGFTIAELLLVCAVMGILLLLAVPRYSALAESIRLRNTAYQFIADTRFAQELAQRDWTRSRLLFGADYYEVQVGTTSNPAADCVTTTGYSVVKREPLGRIAVERALWAGSCLVFDRTGRMAFTAPLFTFMTPSPSAAQKSAMLVDGETFVPSEEIPDPEMVEAVWWSDPVTELELDLGQTMWVGNICAGVVKDNGMVQWPTEIAVASSSAPLGVFPASGDPSVKTVVPTGSGLRICPPLEINANIRYLRFRFTSNSGVLVDEIETFPVVTFTSPSGQFSRTARISPVTGSVTLVNN